MTLFKTIFGRKLLFCAALCVLSITATANEFFKQHAGHKIYFTAFNSSFIQPDIADIYGITRGSDIGLVNISVVKESDEGDSLGLAAGISGRVTNLMMQSRSLEFQEIDEGDAVYYIASFDFDNEEVLHLDIEVQISNEVAPYSFRFTKKMYED